jgi:hypothetical protein
VAAERRRPNFVFVMSDDHAAHAISAYGSRINTTPHLDRIADGDPLETTNVIGDPDYGAVTSELRVELARLQAEFGDEPHPAADRAR